MVSHWLCEHFRRYDIEVRELLEFRPNTLLLQTDGWTVPGVDLETSTTYTQTVTVTHGHADSWNQN